MAPRLSYYHCAGYSPSSSCTLRPKSRSRMPRIARRIQLARESVYPLGTSVGALGIAKWRGLRRDRFDPLCVDQQP